MQDSIFAKIIKGEVPCHKIYEDAKTFVFLDTHPLLPGHVLVVPKTQVDQFDDLSAEDYAALFETVRRVAKQLKVVFGVKRAVVQIMGFDVPHAHVHVLPAQSMNEYYKSIVERVNNADGPPYQPSQKELAVIAQRLRMEDNK